MRKIHSKADEEKRQKRNRTIIGVILVFIMVFSVFGMIAVNPSENETQRKIKYNDYEFTERNNLWATQIGEDYFFFVYLPNQTNLEFDKKTEVKKLNSYAGRPLYVYSEIESSKIEIYRNLYSSALRMQEACYDREKCLEDVPLKNCNDNFIIIEESNTTEITQEDNCVFIRGPRDNLLKLTDLFLYEVIGIK